MPLCIAYHAGAKRVDPTTATVLGSPIGDVSSVSDALTTKVNQLKRMFWPTHQGTPQGPRLSVDPDHMGRGSYHLPLPEAVLAVQQGNCASVMGTTGQLDSGLFY